MFMFTNIFFNKVNFISIKDYNIRTQPKIYFDNKNYTDIPFTEFTHIIKLCFTQHNNYLPTQII